MRAQFPGLALAWVLLSLVSCKSPAVPSADGQGEQVDTVRVDAQASAMEKALDQAWGPANRAIWYERSQGSRLLPLSWFLALEDEGGEPFLSEANVKRWGYLPHVNANKRALPIGFTEDTTPEARLPRPLLTWRKTPTADDRVWVGMNCAACHTSQLTYKDQTITVDGGPALSDFEGFLEDLRTALDATLADEKRFGRFADRVLGATPLEAFTPGPHPVDVVKETFTKGDNDDPENRALLRAALRKVVAREAELKRLNASTGASDYGRLDAFGHIFNKVAMIAQPAGQRIQEPSASDAPVSYPFLWNIPQHDQVQWNGVAPNTVVAGREIGALARNAGEVIGVFGEIQVAGPLRPWPSSIDVQGLVALEKQLKTLRPPAWPAQVFGWGSYRDPAGQTVTHEQLVADGAALFGDPGKPGRCVACHQLLPNRKDLQTPIAAQMALFNPPPGPPKNVHRSSETDIGMACNAYIKTAKGGLMAGQMTDKGRLIRAEGESVALMLKHSVIRAVLGQGDATVQAAQDSIFPTGASQALLAALAGASDKPGALTPEERCLKERNPHLGYKARPLNGVWATAPYLHNGSVRTLYQLLLPPAQREASFEVGNREFDPKEVGYVSNTAANHSTLVTSAKGNSNAGHDYGNDKLTDYQRWALVEFLKTL